MALLVMASAMSGGPDVFGAAARSIPSFGDLAFKAPVRVGTIQTLQANTYAAGVLTANANGALPAIDGVSLAVGDRLLVVYEATTSNRGIYVVTSLGSAGSKWRLTRSADCDTAAEMVAGAAVFVTAGTLLAGTVWYATAAWTPISGNPAWGSTGIQPTANGPRVVGLQAGADAVLSMLARSGNWPAIYMGDNVSGYDVYIDREAAAELSVHGLGGADLTAVHLASVGITGPTPTVQVFTASGTWTKPAGLLFAIVDEWGGGGGGGGVQATGVAQAASSGGGGGGGYARKLFLASALAATETVTVGGGGTAGNATPTAGGPGGNTSFATPRAYVVNAAGGGGGAAGPLTGGSTRGPGGGGATASTGADLALTGSDGGWGIVAAALGLPTGFGGGAAAGGGATGPGAVNAAGVAGAQFGGGGSGAFANASTGGFAGGAGKAGAVIVTEFYAP